MSDEGGFPAQALVLAAGRGTRIAPVSNGLPKPLLRVGGRPLLEWNLIWLAAHGVRRIWINVHHGADAVRARIGDGAAYGVSVRYSWEPELLGTAGAWKRLEREWDGRSLVVYGDNLMRFDLRRLAGAHVARAGCPVTLAVYDPARHRNTGVFGGRMLVGRDGLALGFVERADAGGGAGPAGSSVAIGTAAATDVSSAGSAGFVVNTGVYVLEPELADELPAGFLDFGRDVLPRLAERGVLHTHMIEPDGFCLGLDTPEAFEVAERMVALGEVAP